MRFEPTAPLVASKTIIIIIASERVQRKRFHGYLAVPYPLRAKHI
jgi:hypothetical protein